MVLRKSHENGYVLKLWLEKKTQTESSDVSFFFPWGGTYVTRYCGHFWPIVQPQMIDEGDYGAIGGMKIGRGNRITYITTKHNLNTSTRLHARR
jgi:hypothetical protein